MAFINENYIKIDTPKTSLIYKVETVPPEELFYETFKRYLKPIHYGKKLRDYDNYEYLSARDNTKNTSVSCFGNFDKREPMLLIENADGSLVNDFDFVKAEFTDSLETGDFPSAHTVDKIIKITYEDPRCKLRLINYLCTFVDTDAIVSSYKLENFGQTVKIRKLMSLQCDLNGADFFLYSFHGDWISERFLEKRKLGTGLTVNESLSGMSSHEHNPYILLERERYGDFYAFNFLYSSSHKESIEITFHHSARVLVGINDFAFEYELGGGESFFTPQAVEVYAENKDAAVSEMHRFVNRHIIREKYAFSERPVVLNSWEASYFNFTCEKILDLAKKAKEIGVELFVLDDGWFSGRNDDKHGLGDWTDDVEKTGGGLKQLADKIRALGLKFGIWIEPEMVNPTAELYRAHPDWTMKVPGRVPRPHRHQYVLDLATPEVTEYLKKTVENILLRSGADYVKWDFNRCLAEFYSSVLNNQGEYTYRYMQGLYRLIKSITEAFPDVLFEGCAGGGGRYDLGMMAYMPQIWTSDNTDARVRLKIQESSLYGYPQSVMSAHVSIAPNHQTGNSNSLESRFNVAAAGVLGYEYDLTKISEEESRCMKKQIDFYKKHRRLLQFGEYKLIESVYDAKNKGYTSYIVVSEDKSEAMATVIMHEWSKYSCNKIRFKGLDEDCLYRVSMREQMNVEKCVEFCAYGDALMNGLLDIGSFSDETDRETNSNGIFSRMFYLEKIKAK